MRWGWECFQSRRRLRLLDLETPFLEIIQRQYYGLQNRSQGFEFIVPCYIGIMGKSSRQCKSRTASFAICLLVFCCIELLVRSHRNLEYMLSEIRLLFAIQKFTAELIISRCKTKVNSGFSLTKRESRLQNGTFIYNM